MSDDFDLKLFETDYDWQNAIACSNLDVTEIESVLNYSEGCNDEDSWLAFGKLKNGDYWGFASWCDYTEWDCQSGGDSWINIDKDKVVEGFTFDQRLELFGDLTGEYTK